MPGAMVARRLNSSCGARKFRSRQVKRRNKRERLRRASCARRRGLSLPLMAGTEADTPEKIAGRKRASTAARTDTRMKKFQRGPQPVSGIMEFLLSPDVAALNVLFLHLLGKQAVAACCRASLDWASLNGRRCCLCLDDRKGPPHAPLDRIATAVVQVVHLGRDGRESPEERARVLTACNKAEVLTCTYSNLLGLSRLLDWGGGVSPTFNVRRARFRQCTLTASDVVQFLSCAPHLESLVFVNEKLGSMEEVFLYRPKSVGSEIHSVEFTDCGLTACDAAALLTRLPQLRSVHFQAMDLSGLKMPSLPNLEQIQLLDCCLRRADVLRLMRRCPSLTVLVLCGNPLGEEEPCSWPPMAKLRRADFRHCELTAEDEEALRAQLPHNASFESRVSIGEAAADDPCRSSRRVVFDSDSGSDDASSEE